MKNALTVAVAALAAAGWAQQTPSDVRLGDGRRGAQLFVEQRCVACHSINGVGGKEAPDLARRSTKDFTPSILAGNMWNHGPTMWRGMAARNLPIPRLEPGDVADLFAYFYSLRYFDPPGDAARGKAVFVSARCSRCHEGSDRVGPPVSRWKATTDPVEWAQQMWNHTSGMTEQARKAGIAWPGLTVQQMVDLMVYVQNLPGAQLPPPALKVADPVAGQRLFDSQGCDKCHTIGEPSTRGGIELLRRTERFHTLTEFAVAMWNHGPQMQQRAKQVRAELRPFREAEMGDLLAYLFEKRYFEERGDRGRGARVYKARQCGACHEGGEAGAPALSQFRGRFSSLFMTSALWKHGPQMLAEIEKRSMKWPLFTNTEMTDLISYLNR